MCTYYITFDSATIPNFVKTLDNKDNRARSSSVALGTTLVTFAVEGSKKLKARLKSSPDALILLEK